MEELFKNALPSQWSYAVTEDGRVFFIDEELQLTTWLHPVYGHPVQSGYYTSQDLPAGWEKDFTPSGIPYYINHIDRLTCLNVPRPDVATVPTAGNNAEDSSQPERKKFGALQRSSSKRRSGKKVVEKMPDVKRNPVAIVTRRGWLYKQETTPLKPWKKRWFVLSEFGLFHYKGPEEGQCLGSILVPGYRITNCGKDEDGISRKFAFKAEHENVKTLYFTAESQEDMEAWIEVMSLAAAAELPTRLTELTNPALDQKDNSALPRSKSQGDLKKPSYSVHMSLQADDPQHDQVMAFPARDDVGQGYQNSHAKQWQRRSVDDIDAPWLQRNTVKGKNNQDSQQKNAPAQNSHPGNNLNRMTVVGNEPKGLLSNTGGHKNSDSFPGMQETKEEVRRSKENVVDVSVLAGGRPSLSKSDSKNQDIINWLGITGSSVTTGTDNRQEQISNREVHRTVPDNQRRADNQNVQAISSDINTRKGISVPNGQGINSGHERHVIQYNASKPPYGQDIDYRASGRGRISSGSSSTGDKADEAGQYVRLQEPVSTATRYELHSGDRREQINRGQPQKLEPTGDDGDDNDRSYWADGQFYQSDSNGRQLESENRSRATGTENSKAPPKLVYTHQQPKKVETADVVKRFNERQSGNEVVPQSRQSRYGEIDSMTTQQSSNTTQQSYVPSGLGSKLDAMSSQIKAWSENQWNHPDISNQNKVRPIENEYAIVNRNRSQNATNMIQGSQFPIGVSARSPLQVNQVSVGMNVLNINKQGRQEMMDGYDMWQDPGEELNTVIVPKKSDELNSASNAFQRSMLPSNREEKQVDVKRERSSPRVAVNSSREMSLNVPSEKHQTSKEDPEHLLQLQECKRIIDQHRRERSSVDSFDWSNADSDSVVKQLIGIRRSQARLEETRYWILNRLYQLPVAVWEDNDDMERSELRRQTLELETEISLTNPLIVQLESRLTRRSDVMKTDSQNPSSQGTRVVSIPSILVSSNSNSGIQVTSKQWNNEAVNKPSTYVASRRIESAMTSEDKTFVRSSVEDLEREAKLNRIQELQLAVEDQSFKLGQLREEKAYLMKALYQAQKEEDDERDTQRRMRLRQQRQALDRELFATQRHLAEETKKFEVLTSSSGNPEAGVQVIPSVNFENSKNTLSPPHQFNSNGSGGGGVSMQLIDLKPQANQAVSPASRPNVAAIASPETNPIHHLPHDVARSEPYRSSSTYFETDLDSGVCRDLAVIARHLVDNPQIAANSSRIMPAISAVVTSSPVTSTTTARDNSTSNSEVNSSSYDRNRYSVTTAEQHGQLRYTGHPGTRQFVNTFSDADYNDNYLTSGGNNVGLQHGLNDIYDDAYKQAVHKTAPKFMERKEFPGTNNGHDARYNKLGDVDKTYGLHVTGASDGQRSAANEHFQQGDSSKTTLKTTSPNLPNAVATFATKRVVENKSTTQWDRYDSRLETESDRQLNRFDRKSTMTAAADPQYGVDVSERSREYGRRGLDHPPGSSNRSKSVPRSTTAQNTGSIRAALSDEEEDYTTQPIGVNTADRVRRLSGLYSPRPFVGNVNAAGVVSGQLGSVQSASQVSHAGSSNALRYDAELNSADVDLDELVSRQVQRVSTDRLGINKLESSKAFDPHAPTLVERSTGRQQQLQQTESYDKNITSRSQYDVDRAARHDGVRMQQQRQLQHPFSIEQSSQRSRQPAVPWQPSVQANIRKLLESVDDGSCL